MKRKTSKSVEFESFFFMKNYLSKFGKETLSGLLTLVFLFQFPDGALVASIPRKISTLTGDSFPKKLLIKCVASRHECGDTLLKKTQLKKNNLANCLI